MRLAANPWGLYDMLGNAAEWTAERTYPDVRIVRGGHSASPSWDMRVEAREIWTGGSRAGFRIACPSPNLPPAVVLTAPRPGAALPSGSDVTVAADAFDLDGSISKVEFSFDRDGGTPQTLGQDSTEPYGITWSNVADGCYLVRAEAVDDGGLKTSGETEVQVGTCPRLPFYGEPLAIPGTVEAEDFDLGTNGDAYLDDSPGNVGGAYRAGTDVDLEPTADAGGGFNVGWLGSGEWLEYTVEVAAAGDYELYARVASLATGGAFHVELDGVDKTGVMTVPVTGGWQRWETISATVRLDAGVQVMRWQNASTADGYNLNHFRIVAAGSSFCGDDACDPGEDCSSCANDCAGVNEGWPVGRHCCGNGVAEPAEGDGSGCDGNY